MDPIDLLRQEHREIDRVFERMQQAIDIARGGGRFNAVLQVESNHHLKENVVHSMLHHMGVSPSSPLLRQLGEEHELGREWSDELKRKATAVIRGELDAESLLSSAEAYLRMHRLHSQLERELLPMAQRLLGPEALARIWTRFARIEGRAGSIADAAAALEVAFGNEVRR